MATRYLYHATPLSNLDSILESGLDTSYATGKQVVWLCTESRLQHVIQHAQRKHGINTLVILKVRVQRKQLRKTKWCGVWEHRVTVTPDRLCEVI